MRKNYLLLFFVLSLGFSTSFGQVAKSNLNYSNYGVSEKETEFQKKEADAKQSQQKEENNIRGIHSVSSNKAKLGCPGSSLFSNPLEDYENASNAEGPAGFKIATSFYVDGTIDSVTFWGVSGFFDGTAWGSCTNDDPTVFDLIFYEKDGDNMGDIYQSNIDIVSTAVGTGEMFAGTYEIIQYTIVLPNSISDLTSGFVSLAGKSDNSCWFLWIDAPTGNGMSYQYSDETGEWTLGVPYSICVAGEMNACPAPNDLTVSNLTTTSADLGWTELGLTTEWSMVFTDLDAQVSSTILTTSNPYAKNGLEAQNMYEFSVRAVCGAGDTSIYSMPYQFATPCDVVTTFPLMEDFDGDWNTWCWKVIDADNDDLTWTQANTYISPTHSGEFAAHGMGNQDDYLISPALTLDDDYQISWWDKVESASYNNTYEILVSTTGTNPVDFTDKLLEVNCTNTDWEQHAAYLSNYTGQTVYIAIHQIFSGSTFFGFGIDDVEIDLAPACAPVTNIMVDNIMQTSVEIGWTENGTATAWNIEYGEAGFTPGEGTEVAVTENPYELVGLIEGTFYEVYVQADCGSETSTWAGPYLFGTACDVLTDLNEGFETAVPPICWDAFMGGGSTKTWEQTDANVNSGSFAAKAGYENSGSDNEKWLVTGKITVPAGKALSFFATDDFGSDYASTLNIRISTDADYMNTGAYTNVLTIQEADVVNDVYSPFSVDLSSYEEQDVFIAFVMIDNDGDSWYLDDVAFISCAAPGNLVATDVEQAIATLGWDSNADEFEVEYGVAGFTLGSGTNSTVTENTLTITDLEASTDYEFYVKAICGVDDESAWAGPYAFKTLNAPCDDITSFPYSHGFEGLDVFDCWTPMYNTEADGGLNGNNLVVPPTENAWFVVTPESFQGNGGNYIYEGTRSAGLGYNAPDFNWLVSPNIDLTDKVEASLDFMIWIKDSLEANWVTLFYVNVFDGTNWTTVKTWDENTSDNLFDEEVQIDLTDYVGSMIKVAFIFEYNDGYELAIDNIEIDALVGVNEGLANNVNVYPNPTSNKVWVEGAFEVGTTINLLDVTGKVLMTKIADHNKVSFDLSNAEQGLYFIEVVSGNEKAILRTIKQ